MCNNDNNNNFILIFVIFFDVFLLLYFYQLLLQSIIGIYSVTHTLRPPSLLTSYAPSFIHPHTHSPLFFFPDIQPTLTIYYQLHTIRSVEASCQVIPFFISFLSLLSLFFSLSTLLFIIFILLLHVHIKIIYLFPIIDIHKDYVIIEQCFNLFFVFVW